MLIAGFNAFGNHLQPQTLPQHNNRFQNGSISRLMFNISDKDLINFKAINREIFELG